MELVFSLSCKQQHLHSLAFSSLPLRMCPCVSGWPKTNSDRKINIPYEEKWESDWDINFMLSFCLYILILYILIYSCKILYFSFTVSLSVPAESRGALDLGALWKFLKKFMGMVRSFIPTQSNHMQRNPAQG